MPWTDERVELLKKLWTDGLSCAQVATQMGGLTRNAVIGKIHRLKLDKRIKFQLPVRRRRPDKPMRSNIGGASSVDHEVSYR
jgi:GcrA cell cycle regulator